MNIRVATPANADAITAIYAPVVANTSISFELVPPSVEAMRSRIVKRRAAHFGFTLQPAEQSVS